MRTKESPCCLFLNIRLFVNNSRLSLPQMQKNFHVPSLLKKRKRGKKRREKKKGHLMAQQYDELARRWASGPHEEVFRKRYRTPAPRARRGSSPKAGLRRPWVRSPGSVPKRSLEQIRSSRTRTNYTEGEGAACLYGVPTRGVWQAVVSCLIEEGIKLGEATRLASPVYKQVRAEAQANGWGPEAQVARILSIAEQLGQRAQQSQQQGPQGPASAPLLPAEGMSNLLEQITRQLQAQPVPRSNSPPPLMPPIIVPRLQGGAARQNPLNPLRQIQQFKEESGQ
jgi:hypothetical protein